jgi:hypothetical protein
MLWSWLTTMFHKCFGIMRTDLAILCQTVSSGIFTSVYNGNTTWHVLQREYIFQLSIVGLSYLRVIRIIETQKLYGIDKLGSICIALLFWHISCVIRWLDMKITSHYLGNNIIYCRSYQAYDVYLICSYILSPKRRLIWWLSSSGKWHRVALIRTDVSEDRIASIFRVHECELFTERSCKTNRIILFREITCVDCEIQEVYIYVYKIIDICIYIVTCSGYLISSEHQLYNVTPLKTPVRLLIGLFTIFTHT